MKRMLSIITTVILTVGLLLPAVSAADTGFSVDKTTVSMSADAGSFTITVNKYSEPYGGVRIYLDIPTGLELASDNPFVFSLTEGLKVGPNKTSDGKTLIEFATPGTNGIDGDLKCTVNIKYSSGADKANKTVAVDKVELLKLFAATETSLADAGVAVTYTDRAAVTVSQGGTTDGTTGGNPVGGGGGGGGGGSLTASPAASPAAITATGAAVTGGAISLAAKPTAALDKSNAKSYINGYPDGTFLPTANITRAEASSMIYALITDSNKAAYKDKAAAFSDVASNAWYAEATAYLSAAEVIEGYPDGTFGGGRPITRAEFATIMTRLEAAAGGGNMPFTDVTGHWAYSSVLAAYNNKWITGYPDNTFLPNQSITRAEAVTIVNRVIGRDKSVYEGMAVKFSDVASTAWYYGDVLAASSDRP
ncbi:MAG: S-layer homology domain-containing protein [Clostridiales Family XIII bacterium]|jgi:hypothetical protein|nr:S-layer homology domain-containing protein [Clostridiales Family XIII bacterium]